MDGDLASRVTALEERVAALTAAAHRSPEPTPGAGDPELPWALQGLRDSAQVAGGSVVFAGEVEIAGRHALYQWQRPTDLLLEQSWDQHLERLAAIAHPIRGMILRRLLRSPATVAELVAEELVSSTGTAYHHLGALHSGGWTTRGPDGRHSVRTSRVVALLSIIAAAEDH